MSVLRRGPKRTRGKQPETECQAAPRLGLAPLSLWVLNRRRRTELRNADEFPFVSFQEARSIAEREVGEKISQKSAISGKDENFSSISASSKAATVGDQSDHCVEGRCCRLARQAAIDEHQVSKRRISHPISLPAAAIILSTSPRTISRSATVGFHSIFQCSDRRSRFVFFSTPRTLVILTWSVAPLNSEEKAEDYGPFVSGGAGWAAPRCFQASVSGQ